MNIYALSSGRGPSGIAIIRLSGPGKDTYKNILKNYKENQILIKREVNFCKFYDPKT